MAHARAEEVQKGINFNLKILGVDDWRKIVPTELDLSHGGLGKLDTEGGLRKIAEINQTSFELSLMGYLAWQFCDLLELEVESSNHPEWGKMVWIPDHPSYNEPPKDDFEKHFRMNFYRAMFQTEKAGIQYFCLYSTAINGRFHKSLVFYRAVLRPRSSN